MMEMAGNAALGALAGKRRAGCHCTHLPQLWEAHSPRQLQRSLLRHFQERKAAGAPLLPLGEGALCLACSAACPLPKTHPDLNKKLPCPGPPVLLDLRTGELYCTACADYVFDRGFDLALQTALAAAKGGGTSAAGNGASDGSVPPPSGSTMGQDDRPPPPQHCTAANGQQDGQAAELQRLLAEGGFRPLAADGFPTGLRGLNNLGNTCFMNSVLQALLHAPLLRNHYLLNRHSRAGCGIAADGGFCVNCELDGLFSAAYSGRRAGYSPAQFLHTWWMLAGGHMAGYQQQDAHEFFCFVLEMMAATAMGAENITSRVFGGTLRSDLICSSCGHVSTSHEHFSHLSLDIPPPQSLIAPTILPRPTGGAGSQATAAAMAAAAAASAAAGRKAASAPAPAVAGGGGGGSHHKGAGSSAKAAAAANHSGASKASKLVGAAKLSHERALARKAAEAAAVAANGGGGSDMQSVFDQPPAAVAQGQQQGQLLDTSSEGEVIDICASDSPSLGVSVGAGGMVGQSGLEAASGIGAQGSVFMLSDDAQDTLSSPRQQMIGAPPQILATSGGGGGVAPAAAPSWWQPPPAQQQQQQQQQQGRPPGTAGGRPPVPPGARSGRGGAVGAVAGSGSRRPGGRQQQPPPGFGDESSPERDTTAMLLDGSGQSTAAIDAALGDAAAAGLLPAGQQDALAAATNVPGTQGPAAAAGAASAAAMPPQLAGYYRWPGASLLGCLNRFTHAEQLGSGERWTCERCMSGAHAVKQLSLRHLPPLLVFHAKRFEHAGGLRAVARKLDTYLSFPLRDLDMRPYLASAVLRSRFRLPPPQPQPALAAKARHAASAPALGQLAEAGAAGVWSEGGTRRKRSGASPLSGSRRGSGASLGSPPSGGGLGSAQPSPAAVPAVPAAAAAAIAAAEAEQDSGGAAPGPGQYLYDLFAVVCHRGSFQGGHYVAYVRAADQRWYLCDDAWVTASDEEAVRNSQAYMLFYSQKQLLEAR